MDDLLVLAPSRWKLRRAVKEINETLHERQLKRHPDKTFVGKIEKGESDPISLDTELA